MLRRLFSILSLLSLLLCGVAFVLWQIGRGDPPAEEMRVRESWLYGSSRFTAVLHPESIRVYGPPAPPADADPVRRQILSRIRNSDVLWQASASDPQFKDVGYAGPAVFDSPLHEGDPWSSKRVRYQISDPATRTPLLLEALEDPDRFAVAHMGLVEIHESWQSISKSYQRMPDGTIRVSYCRLTADLHDPRDVRTDSSDTHFADFTATIDPGQQAMLRSYWHQRLDVQVARVPYWLLGLATGLLPALWLFLRLRRMAVVARRVRRGECRHCGFDLRATRERCPECGNATVR